MVVITRTQRNKSILAGQPWIHPAGFELIEKMLTFANFSVSSTIKTNTAAKVGPKSVGQTLPCTSERWFLREVLFG